MFLHQSLLLSSYATQAKLTNVPWILVMKTPYYLLKDKYESDNKSVWLNAVDGNSTMIFAGGSL
jgi:hypothetical protein